MSQNLGTKQCSVCLEDIQNRCVSNSCRHEFCFKCLKKWSKEKNYCPLCRAVYSQIIHNIKNDEEFDVFEVGTDPLELNIPNRSSITPYFLRTRIRRPNIYGITVSDHLSRRHSTSSTESDESSESIGYQRQTLNRSNERVVNPSIRCVLLQYIFAIVFLSLMLSFILVYVFELLSVFL